VNRLALASPDNPKKGTVLVLTFSHIEILRGVPTFFLIQARRWLRASPGNPVFRAWALLWHSHDHADFERFGAPTCRSFLFHITAVAE
jgi:hypothetical protein